MIDKAVFPRDKCCGDGLTTLALRELELLGFDPAAVRTGRSSTGPCCGRRRAAQVTVPLPPGPGIYAAVAPRQQFDAALVDLAVKAGVTVLEGHGFDGSLVERADHVVIGVDRSPIDRRPLRDRRRRHVEPGAQGRSGATNPATCGEWHAFRQYARHVTGPAADHLYVWFEPDFLPGLRVVVPAARRPGQHRLRCAARRHPATSRTWRSSGPGCSIDRTSSPRSAPMPSSRAGTRRGRSRPGSTRRRWRPGACCSSATRRWRPT